MTKVWLVDGTYELFRAHFGSPPARDRDGREVGAVRGLMRSLASLLGDPHVTHVACAFDTRIESFRNDLFAGYKTAEGVAPELLAQFPLGERAAHALGIVVWPMVEFEADDALATAAARFRDAPGVEQVLLCSPDKDLAQCVRGSRVVMWDRRNDVVLDEDAVVAKFGVPPASIPDLLALIGDSADGVPGVPRWGAKSASTVLARWRHVDAIPSDPIEWDVKVRGAQALAQSLANARDVVGLYRTLTTLREDVPLTETLADLAWSGARRAELEALCEELDFGSFAERFAVPPRAT